MIGIINYGLGNTKAFQNIYKRLNIKVALLNSKEDFYSINKLILPGVGSFDHAMKTFSNSGLREMTEKKVFEEKTPIIGVCVGMQMLAHSSEEGKLPGLGWINGEVKKFNTNDIKYATHLPHMGWNNIYYSKESRLFNNFPSNPVFYFLHSFYLKAHDSKIIIAKANYGIDFTAAVNHNNIYGVQFHPEKSHSFGTSLLKNFAEL